MFVKAEGDDGRWVPQHTFDRVFGEALLTVCRFYPGLPDPRTLDLDEIVFFYNGLRRLLTELTKPR